MKGDTLETLRFHRSRAIARARRSISLYRGLRAMDGETGRVMRSMSVGWYLEAKQEIKHLTFAIDLVKGTMRKMNIVEVGNHFDGMEN